MQYLALSLPSIAENLALDEALLNEADQLSGAGREAEVLRIWELTEWAVVVGRATQVDQEVRRAACERDGIPVYRRCSGGTSVVAGPGCLMYAVLVSYEGRPELRSVDTAHHYVMERMQAGLSQLHEHVEFRGSCDLTIGDRKFSGNALRCKRKFLLYHGTVLYDFPLDRISKYLATPPRQPDYREGRDHASFVTNFPADATAIKDAIRGAWKAKVVADTWPEQATADLVRQRYSRATWNLGR